MHYSKYNIIVPLENYPGYSVIQNLYHGGATIIGFDLAKRLTIAARTNNLEDIAEEDIASLKERSFVYASPEEERQQILQRYESAKKTALAVYRKYMVLLTYSCNLRCLYCFQKERHHGGTMTRERLARVLATIDQQEKEALAIEATFDKSEGLGPTWPSFNIVGGEPLQYEPHQVDLLSDIISWCKARDMKYSFISNGYDLVQFVPFLVGTGFLPGTVQVTIDGVGEQHDHRRPHVSKGGSFDKIIEGIDAAIKAEIRIDLRVNIDRGNIDCLDMLAKLIVEHEWDKSGLLSCYATAVTDHSGFNTDYEELAPEKFVFRNLLQKLKSTPEVRRLFKLNNFKGYEFVRNSVMDGKKASPLFFRCESMLGQKVFDPSGAIYTCYEGAGDARAKVGEYDPEFVMFPERREQWLRLDSIRSDHCKNCPYVFVCGGGCPWHTLQTGKTECMPIKQQIQLSWNYFSDVLMEDDKAPEQAKESLPS